MNRKELEEVLQRGESAGDIHLADEIKGQGFSACCKDAGIPEPEEDLDLDEEIEYLKENAPEWCKETIRANIGALKNYLDEDEEA